MIMIIIIITTSWTSCPGTKQVAGHPRRYSIPSYQNSCSSPFHAKVSETYRGTELLPFRVSIPHSPWAPWLSVPGDRTTPILVSTSQNGSILQISDPPHDHLSNI